MIFDIQRFSTHDGEGIRTLVFFKGCPLHCLWCCNPESQSFGHSLMYDHSRCHGFGDCLEAAASSGQPEALVKRNGHGLLINRTSVSDPEAISDVCPAKALTVSGTEKSTAELVQEIEKDLPFYREGGGVTFSGGEPLSHSAELVALMTALKGEQINTAIETSLHVAWEMIEPCIPLTDCFLVDLKHTDEKKFRQFTGGSARLVMSNLEQLSRPGVRIIARIPVIPGFNHTEEEMHSMVDYVCRLDNIREIHFLPYHRLGVQKYEMLGLDDPFPGHQAVPVSEIGPYLRYARTKDITCFIGG